MKTSSHGPGWASMQQNQGHLCFLKKGKLSDNRFKIPGEYIPTIKDKPVKSLGKRFDQSLKDAVAIQETRDRLERWLNKINMSGLPGCFKARIYLHVVLRSLTIYEFTSYNVEQLEKRINSRLRRWFAKMPLQRSPIRKSQHVTATF